MKKIIHTSVLLAIVALFPIVTLAAGKDLRYIAGLIIEYLNIGLALIMGLALVTFVWNVYIYFFTQKVEEKKDAGLYVLWSVIGFFVIISFWGLVSILRNTFNLDDQAPDSFNIYSNDSGFDSFRSNNPSGTFRSNNNSNDTAPVIDAPGNWGSQPTGDV